MFSFMKTQIMLTCKNTVTGAYHTAFIKKDVTFKIIALSSMIFHGLYLDRQDVFL